MTTKQRDFCKAVSAVSELREREGGREGGRGRPGQAGLPEGPSRELKFFGGKDDSGVGVNVWTQNEEKVAFM